MLQLGSKNGGRNEERPQRLTVLVQAEPLAVVDVIHVLNKCEVDPGDVLGNDDLSAALSLHCLGGLGFFDSDVPVNGWRRTLSQGL